jgi:uncharacterized protein YndB with AHSA1/START domain
VREREAVLRLKRIIPASPEAIWSILTDTRLWPVWGPSVAAVETNQRYLEPGSKGRIRTVLGFWVGYEVTHFAPGRAWSWKVAGIPATVHEVRPLGPDRSILEFAVPFWAAPYLIVCALAARRIEAIARRAPDGAVRGTR